MNLELISAGLSSLKEYIAVHVLTCLLPAFLLAGAMVSFVSKEVIIAQLGHAASKQKAVFSNPLTLRITDLGMEKGKSPASEERVATATMAAKSWLLVGHGIEESTADSTESEARP